MSIYIGKDNVGDSIIHLTKGSASASQMAAGPIPGNTSFHSKGSVMRFLGIEKCQPTEGYIDNNYLRLKTMRFYLSSSSQVALAEGKAILLVIDRAKMDLYLKLFYPELFISTTPLEASIDIVERLKLLLNWSVGYSLTELTKLGVTIKYGSTLGISVDFYVNGYQSSIPIDVIDLVYKEADTDIATTLRKCELMVLKFDYTTLTDNLTPAKEVTVGNGDVKLDGSSIGLRPIIRFDRMGSITKPILDRNFIIHTNDFTIEIVNFLAQARTNYSKGIYLNNNGIYRELTTPTVFGNTETIVSSNGTYSLDRTPISSSDNINTLSFFVNSTASMVNIRVNIASNREAGSYAVVGSVLRYGIINGVNYCTINLMVPTVLTIPKIDFIVSVDRYYAGGYAALVLRYTPDRRVELKYVSLDELGLGHPSYPSSINLSNPSTYVPLTRIRSFSYSALY